MKRRRLFVALLVVLFLFAFAMPALVSHTAAQIGGYDLAWNTIDGGGHTFSLGGSYFLGGTAGQPDAGLLTGEGYTLGGGFWGGGAQASAEAGGVYLPIILKNY